MHLINVLTFGSRNFNTSLEELKDYLNFKLTFADKEINKENLNNYDVLILHQDSLAGDSLEKLLKDSKKIKILVSNTSGKKKDQFKFLTETNSEIFLSALKTFFSVFLYNCHV